MNLMVLLDLKVEWFKSSARAKRWEEELELVREEMGRVIRYHQWQADRWKRSSEDVQERADVQVMKGVIAYGEKQEAMWKVMGDTFRGEWSKTLSLVGTTIAW